MRGFMKGLLYAIITLILLSIVAVAVMMLVIDPNQYRQLIATRVQQITGRPFNIQGKLHWTIFPNLGIAVEKVHLGNPVGFPQTDFLTIPEATLSLAFKPLLSGHLQFGKVILNGAEIHLIRNTQGLGNWVFARPSQHDTISQVNMAATKNSVTSSWHQRLNISAATLAGIDIEHAQIQYEDLSTHQQTVIKDFNLKASNITLDKAFPLQIQLLFSQSNFPHPVPLYLQTEVRIFPQQQQIKMSALQIRLANLTMQGNLHLQLQPAFLMNGHLQISTFDAQQLLSLFGKENLPAEALRQVSLATNLSLTSQQVELTGLQAKIDETHLAGQIGVQWHAAKTLRFMLSADQLNLARYQNNNRPPVAMASLSPVTEAVADTPEQLLPVELLRAWNAQGILRIAKLQSNQATLTQVVMPVNLQQGILQISPLQTNIDGGNLQANIRINTQPTLPQWNIQTRVQKINVQSLLNNLKKMHLLQLSGNGNLDAQLTMNGNNAQALLGSLNGRMQFNVTQGVLHGIDILYYSDLADALVSKRQPTQSDTHQTAFQQMDGTIQFVNGIANNQDLRIRLPKLDVTGKGSANLVTQQLNYQLLLQRLTSGSVVKNRGPAIPLLITGNFANPQIRPDWQGLLITAASQQLQEQIDAGSQKLAQKVGALAGNNKLGQQLQQGLQSLLGN